MQPLYVDKSPLRLSSQQVIQSGGEGAVFECEGTAVKVFHEADRARAGKIRQLLDGSRPHLPSNVLRPLAPVLDQVGRIAGYQMALLPAAALPFKKLTQPAFCRQLDFTIPRLLPYLLAPHRTLTQLHDAGVVVGDLNDRNIYFLPARQGRGAGRRAQTFWIDADSFQFGRYPCSVAALDYLDPHLYDVDDFSRKPYFSPATDWYSFCVLLVKCLLHVHPYGGVHHELKSLKKRALAGLTVFSEEIIYPKSALPPSVLSDELIAHFTDVFREGQRPAFPLDLLRQYAHSLTSCSSCGLHYPAARPGCPICQKRTVAIRPSLKSGKLRTRRLLSGVGVLVYVSVRPHGRINVVARNRKSYRFLELGVGGMCRELPLFRGMPGYIFARFGDVLAVAAPHSDRLLLLDVAGLAPRQLGLVANQQSSGTTTFAATSSHLYRVTGGQVLRGSVRNGNLVEEIVASAHRNQTWLWASPFTDTLLLCQRHMRRLHLTLITPDARQIPLTSSTEPLTASGLVDTCAYFGQETVAFLAQVAQGGRTYSYLAIFGIDGRQLHEERIPAQFPPYDRLQGKALLGTTLLHPTDEGILRTRPDSHALLSDAAPYISAAAYLQQHPAGILAQESGDLFLLKDRRTPDALL